MNGLMSEKAVAGSTGEPSTPKSKSKSMGFSGRKRAKLGDRLGQWRARLNPGLLVQRLTT